MAYVSICPSRFLICALTSTCNMFGLFSLSCHDAKTALSLTELHVRASSVQISSLPSCTRWPWASPGLSKPGVTKPMRGRPCLYPLKEWEESSNTVLGFCRCCGWEGCFFVFCFFTDQEIVPLSWEVWRALCRAPHTCKCLKKVIKVSLRTSGQVTSSSSQSFPPALWGWDPLAFL